jgi:hypothetical protein
MKSSVMFGMLGLAAMAVGCGDMSDKAAAKILDQASFDLQCDKTKLSVQKISDDASFGGVKNYTFGARGCDKQATYKASCSGWTDCSVMTDAQANALQQGQTGPAAPAAQPAAAQPAAAPSAAAPAAPAAGK